MKRAKKKKKCIPRWAIQDKYGVYSLVCGC